MICIDVATGKVVRTIPLDNIYPTSCAFGGKDYKTLLITSAKQDVMENPGINGGVCTVTFTDGTQGVPTAEFIE